MGKAELKPEKIEKLIEDLTDENEIRKRVVNVVADFFFNLKSILNEKRHDPVYRQIMDRLERLRLEWITRVINTRVFLSRLKAIEEELTEYNRKIYGKVDEGRIAETLEHYIGKKVEKEVELNNAQKAVKEVLNGSIRIFTPQHEKKIKTELLKDLFLGGVDEEHAKTLIDELIEYVEEELNRLWRG